MSRSSSDTSKSCMRTLHVEPSTEASAAGLRCLHSSTVSSLALAQPRCECMRHPYGVLRMVACRRHRADLQLRALACASWKPGPVWRSCAIHTTSSYTRGPASMLRKGHRRRVHGCTHARGALDNLCMALAGSSSACMTATSTNMMAQAGRVDCTTEHERRASVL